MKKDPWERYVHRKWARESSWGRARRRSLILHVCAAILMVAVASLLVTVAFTEQNNAWIMCKPGGEVNIRPRATTHGQPIGRFAFGDGFVASRAYKDWVYSGSLGIEEGEGWVSADYVVYDRPEEIPGGRVYTVRASGRVAIWKGLSCSSRACWVRPGDRVTVWALSEGWALTDRGYIRRSYLAEE